MYSQRLNEALMKLAIPLRFSILALLSSRKASLFDFNENGGGSLLHLVTYLIDKGFTSDRHAELVYEDDEYFWRAEEPNYTDNQPCGCKFHQIAIELLITKPGLLNNE